MKARAFALFETAIGSMAIAWGSRGVVAVRLPEADAMALRARMVRRFPDAREELAPPGVDLAVRDMTRLIAGERVDLCRIAIDMADVPEFNARVYAAARAIPPGETRTYGEVAEAIGDRTAARAVGAALGANPFPVIVPCHRVLAANGRSGGFSARGGVATKMRLLAIEQARIGSSPTLFDEFGGLPLAVGS
ncbi:MAG TPA: methylated-DNA--[protein]-cysteine S-methyltransferase [Bauldia sp.]|nr:methylated-DNA--[protein]-cysteine S-methyltransferase [Bauldia sp.]